MNKVIDLSYLNEISGGDKSFIREMLELFNSTTGTEAEQFDALLRNSDYDGIGHLAHKMKAPIQMLGANTLFQLIRDLEKFGKEKINLDKIPHMIQEVKAQVQIACAEIEDLLKSL